MTKRCTGVLICAIATLALNVATAGTQGVPTTGTQGVPTTDAQGVPTTGTQGVPTTGTQGVPTTDPRSVATPSAPNVPRFIIRARAAVMNDVVSRHGFRQIQVLHDAGSAAAPDVERVVLLMGREGMSAEEVDAEMDADPDVTACERDRGLLLSELADATNIMQSVEAIQQALATRTLATFYGTLSASTYVSQPASDLIRLRHVPDDITGRVTVAIIDTGVDATHPLLSGSVLPGFDFTREQAGSATDVLDLNQSTAAILEQSTAAILEQKQVVFLNQSTAAILEQSTAAILEGLPPLPAAFGHGTMVAGLVHLTAPTASILPLKAFNADGSSTIATVVRAIYYAVDNGANVINMSFSVAHSSPELMKAINYAASNSVTCVAAVGNLGLETIVYPAGYRNVIAVASTSNTDQRSVFSNYGDVSVTIAAPGEGLTTTFPGGHFAVVSGTSFSTALVSGGVALLIDASPSLTPRQAMDNLRRAAKVSPPLGFGRLDLKRALDAFR